MLAVVFCIASFVVGIAVGRAWTRSVDEAGALRAKEEMAAVASQIGKGLGRIEPASYSFIADRAMAEAKALMAQVNRFSNTLIREVDRHVESLLKEGHVVEVHMGTKPVRYGKGEPTAFVRVVPEDGAVRIVVEKKP